MLTISFASSDHPRKHRKPGADVHLWGSQHGDVSVSSSRFSMMFWSTCVFSRRSLYPQTVFSHMWRCFLLWLSNEFLFLWWLDERNKADICHCFHSQAHDYIIAGGCLAVGFRFAGSANSEAFDCLVSGHILPTYRYVIFLKVLWIFLIYPFSFSTNLPETSCSVWRPLRLLL